MKPALTMSAADPGCPRPLIERADSVHVDALHGSPNFNDRIGFERADLLLLHYTGMADCDKAIGWLSNPESSVSCHYVVDVDGRITQLVAEEYRAWHAGLSYWAGCRDINSASIGIEIHNLGHERGYPAFPESQMRAVEELSLDIIHRNCIRPERVLAHSDVAPQRKGDPGEKFDWPRLAQAGIGYLVEPVAVDPGDSGIGVDDATTADHATITAMQALLQQFGYECAPTGVFDVTFEKTLLAFQRHYRPGRCDGRLDHSTMATLQRLLDNLVAPTS